MREPHEARQPGHTGLLECWRHTKADGEFRRDIGERAVAASSAERRPFAIYRFFMPPDEWENIPRLLSVRSRHSCNCANNETLPSVM
jgi:hypothetical protein